MKEVQSLFRDIATIEKIIHFTYSKMFYIFLKSTETDELLTEDEISEYISSCDKWISTVRYQDKKDALVINYDDLVEEGSHDNSTILSIIDIVLNDYKIETYTE